MYDYVLKIDPRNFEYIMSLLKRLKKNPNIKILVADNDLNYKNKIAKLLRIHKYKVYTASDGVKAKQILDKHPDIKMVLTEFKIPKIDGFALTYAIRENYKKEDMAVIGMTSSDDPILSTSFLKHGADDIVLEKVAGILRNRVRKSDLVARIGGEEFCFLAVNMKKKYVYKIFDDLRKKIEKTNIEIGDGIKINITVSIGIFNIFLPTIDEMVKKADDLLYEAKKNGRNMIVMN